MDILETTARDVRYAFRALRRSPGFTITAVTVLALAIGANTAMFSVLNTVLFRPLPYPAPHQIAVLWLESPTQNLREGRTAYWNIEQWRAQSQSFTDLAFYDGVSATLTSSDRAEKISVVRHSAKLLPLLGVQPVLGRTFSDKEAEQRQPLASISYRFWQTHFGSSSDAIGASLNIDGLPTQVIGVLPASFTFGDADVWEPYTLVPDWETVRRAQGIGYWSVIGRLRPNVSFEQAQAEMSAIARRLDTAMPVSDRNRGITVVPLSRQVTGSRARVSLWMLTGAVFLVLLIAATNVASLSLARSVSREQEIAVRVALGAKPVRIVWQLLTESLLLSATSGLLGLGVAVAGTRLIVVVRAGDLARLNDVSVDARVLGAAFVFCLSTGVLVGLAPALAIARRNLRLTEQDRGRAVTSGLRTRDLRRALVAAQFALAIILLGGAGLLIRSLWSVENVDLGFSPDRVLAVALAPPTGMLPAQRVNFYTRVLEQVAALPGVEKAGIASEVFIGGNAERLLTVPGEAQSVSLRLRLRSDEVSAEFFKTLSAPLLKGRFFSAEEGSPSSRVAIINNAMARRLWANHDPIGQRFVVDGPGGNWFTVVGVVGDMRRQGLENEPIPQMFEPLSQNPPRRAILLIRTSASDPMKLAGGVRAAILDVNKYGLIYGATTLESLLGGFLTQRRFQTSLLAAFAGVALVMAAIGIYGLIQYSVCTRTREIGIRIALGARPALILRMIIGEGLKLALIGLAAGLVGSLWLAETVSSLLFGVRPSDPLTFGSSSALLVCVAVAACFVPARRAMKTDPVVALRQG